MKYDFWKDPERRKAIIEARKRTMEAKKNGTLPLCLCGCGQHVKDFRHKYIDGHCSNDPKFKKKIADTQKTEEFRKKTIERNRAKYGHDWAFQSEEIKEKCTNSMIEKYGVKSMLCSGEQRDNWEKKYIDENGVFHNPSQTEEAKEKRVKTNLEKYGTTNVSKSDVIINKIKLTCESKYGDNPSRIEEFKEKRRQTNIKRFGVDSIMKTAEFRNKRNAKNRERAWDVLIRSNKWEPCFTKEEFLKTGWLVKNNIEDRAYYPFKCKKCGAIQNMCTDLTLCKNCYPFAFRSHSEVDIQSYIESLGVQTVPSERSILSGSKELDIYIPSKSIAIEFDGLYWHSTAEHPEADYHLRKTKECEEKGIQLVHVFEDEWLNKQDIVKSRIKNILGIYDKVVYARKCEVREIKNKKEYIDFLNDNHIQGYVASKHPIGLYYDNELVSCMTFGGLRKSMGSVSTEGVYEMLRFCNKMGYHIPGAASRLFKYFVKHYNPVKVISYCDRRWSKGNLYEKLGFRMSHVSQPNYWYIDPTYSFREYRFKYRKSELPKLLECFDPTLTEQQNMIGNGFGIIYDCGNYVFEWVK